MRLNRRDDSGVTTILVVFCSAVLLASVAIAVDVGRAVAVTRSAQNSADAVALAMAKDCVLRGGIPAGREDDYIRATSAIGNGQNAKLTDGSCDDEDSFVTATADETMDYSFAKIVGLTDTSLDRPATARWGQLSSGFIFPFTFSTCAFPDSFTAGDATTQGTKLMLYGNGVRDECDRDPDSAGQAGNSKGFVAGGCQMVSIDPEDDNKLTDAQGNSFVGTNCDETNLNDYVGTDVLLPVWGATEGSPSEYTIQNLVGFRVLGCSGNGNGPQDKGGAMSKRCTTSDIDFIPDIESAGDSTNPCLYGYVTSFTSTTGGTTGASCTSGALQSACLVYLDS